MNFLCWRTIRIPGLPRLFSIAKAGLSTVELVNCVTSDSVDLFIVAMWALPASVSPLRWSHVLMDAKELVDIGYI